MRIGVLTFHRCINYGSYWQARCLVEGLRASGHDAVLLDHESTRVTRAELRCAFQPLLPRRTARGDLPRYAAKARKFLHAFDALPRTKRFRLDAPETMPEQDIGLVGSDEVWNHRHPWYGGEALFYGVGLKARRRIAYAASFGNQDATEGLHPWWAEQLRGFDAISVRDANSRTLVREATGSDPPEVLDPCLQFPPDVPAEEAEAARPYCAVYGHSFPDWFVVSIRALAARRGWQLRSIGYRNDWADEQRIEAGPHDFARVMAGASAVVTNFFHGCVFALLNEKPFVCAASPYRANKLCDLTRAVGAGGHLVSEATDLGEYARLLDSPLPPHVGARIAVLRQQSSHYLRHALA